MARDPYASLKHGLVGAWIPSISGSGLLLPDLSGRGNNGTLTNMDASDWVASGTGKALDFDGSNDYVDTGTQLASLNGIVSFTMAFWGKRNAANSALTVGKRSADADYILIAPWIDGNVYFEMSGYFPSASSNLTSWAHYAMTLRNGTIRGYINGAEVASGTGPATVPTVASNYLLGLEPVANRYSNGHLDDMRVYSRALTESEIKLLASDRGIGFKPNKKLSRFSTRYTYQPPKAKVFEGVRVRDHDYASLRHGLVGCWCPSLANGGSGNILPDQSGRGNNGTLTNMSAGAWVASGSGRALDFDGVDDRVEGTIEAGKEIRSISIWLNPASTINASSSGLAILNLKGPGASNIFWYIAVGASTGFLTNEYITLVDHNNYREGIADGGSISGWTHFAASWNGTRYSLYLNGQLKTSITNAVGSPRIGTTTRDHFRIASLDDGTIPFAGLIDDVRVYERSLTESEIKLLASKRGIGLQPSPTRFIAKEKKTGLRRRILTGQT